MARKTPEINASSTADIAFLLLVFFLVTTTMDIDTGITRKLPPPPPEDMEDIKVKERNIFKRESLFGLNIGAYLLSKVKILGLVGLVEIGLFFGCIHVFLDLDLSPVLSFIALCGLYFSGMSLGLMLSRWCVNVQKAVIAVPIVIIPQIVFSKFVLPENTLKGLALSIEKMMVVKWGFEAMTASVSGKVVLEDFFSSMIVLILLGFLFLLLTLFHLWFVKD